MTVRDPRRVRSGAAALLILTMAFASAACTGSASRDDTDRDNAPNSAVTTGNVINDADTDDAAADPTDGAEAADAVGASLAATIPDSLRGLYGLEQFHPRVNGQTMSFTAPGECTDVLDLLPAGQWSATVLFTPDDVPAMAANLMPWYLVKLRSGDRSAFLQLTAGAYTCDGKVRPTLPLAVTVAGAENASGDVPFQPFQCGPNIFSPDTMTLAGFYDLPGGTTMVINGDFPAEEGEGELEYYDDDPLVSIAAAPDGSIQLYADALKESLKSEGGELQIPDARQYFPSDTSQSAVNIESLYPLEGTVTLTGLTDEAGRELDVTAPFYCDTTPLPEKAESDTDGDDGADDTIVPGSVTVEVSDGPHRGSHTAEGKVTCEYGLSAPEAWWLFFSTADLENDDAEAPDPEDLEMLMLWSVPPEHAGAPLALYSEPFRLDMGFGAYAIDRSQQIHIGGDDGGKGGTVTADGNTVSATAVTADGIDITVTASCPEITEN